MTHRTTHASICLVAFIVALASTAHAQQAPCPAGLEMYGNASAGYFCCAGTVNVQTQSCNGSVCALVPGKEQGNPLCPAPDACAGKGTLYGATVGGFCCDGTVAGGYCSAPETVCALDPARAQGFPTCCAPGLTNYGRSAGGFCCQGTVDRATDSCHGTVCALDPTRTQGNAVCPPPDACRGKGQMYGVGVGGFCCQGNVVGDTCTVPSTICALDAAHPQGQPLCSTGCPAGSTRQSDGYCYKRCPDGWDRTAVCTCARGGLVTDCDAYGAAGTPTPSCASGELWGGLCYSAACSSIGGSRTASCTCQVPHQTTGSCCPVTDCGKYSSVEGKSCPAGYERTAVCTCERITTSTTYELVTDCGRFGQSVVPSYACPAGTESYGGVCYHSCPAATKRTAVCTCERDQPLEVRTDCSQFGRVDIPPPACVPSLHIPEGPPLDVTFLVATDIHFGATDRGFTPTVHQQQVNAMNSIRYQRWPAGFTGANQSIGWPVGLVTTGDNINWALDKFLDIYREFYEPGRKRTDMSPISALDSFVTAFPPFTKPIDYPVWPGYGNHEVMTDGYKPEQGDSDVVLAAKRATALALHVAAFDRIIGYLRSRVGGQGCADVGNFDSTTGNYSWNWGRLHLVQLNIVGMGLPDIATLVPGAPSATAGTFDDTLQWLKADLQANQAKSGHRPVVVFLHYSQNGVESDKNWGQTERQKFRTALAPYDVVAVFSGHDHVAGVYEPADSRTTYFRGSNGGHTQSQIPAGFYVVRVTEHALDAAFYEWCTQGTPTACTGGSCAEERCSLPAAGSASPAWPTVVFNPAFSRHKTLAP
jgi:cytolysin (calcineurin-like family phosphatase)